MLSARDGDRRLERVRNGVWRRYRDKDSPVFR
jgi:hypothetical protein